MPFPSEVPHADDVFAFKKNVPAGTEIIRSSAFEVVRKRPEKPTKTSNDSTSSGTSKSSQS